MKNIIRKVLKTATLRQSTLTIAATIVNGVLGIMFYALLARFLNVADYGIVAISILTITLVADVANVGTDTGIIRFVGKYISEDRNRALKYLKFGLIIKLVACAVILFLGWFLMPMVAITIFRKSELVVPFRFALVGSSAALVFSFSTSALQALQKFKTWSVLNISLNSLRLIFLLTLIAIGSLTIESALTVYIIFPLIGFFCALLILPRFFSVNNERSVAREFLQYNLWIAAFSIVAAISSRLDSYLTTGLLSLSDVGIYSVAVNLASVVPQIVFAIATVVAPKLAAFQNKSDLVVYLKKLQLFLLSLSFFGVVMGSFFGALFIPAVYGSQYVSSIPPFIILLIAQALFLISVPVHTSIIYYYAKPSVFVFTGVIHLLIIFLLGSQLISLYGVMGAALTVLVGNISNFLLPALWLTRKVRYG